MKKKSCVQVQSTHLLSAACSWRAEERRRLNVPASFKWEHFGFLVKYNDEGKRLVDKTVTVCRHCGTRKPYDSGKTSSMATQNEDCSTTAYHRGICLVLFFSFSFFLADPKNYPIRQFFDPLHPYP